MACRNPIENYYLIELLLKLGANPNQIDGNGDFPIECVCIYIQMAKSDYKISRCLQLIQLLIDYGTRLLIRYFIYENIVKMRYVLLDETFCNFLNKVECLDLE